MLRTILIDPISRTISEAAIAEGLEGVRYALGAMDPAFSGTVECVQIGQRADLWICEEGNLTEGRAVWTLMGQPFAGSAIILYNDGEGECESVPELITPSVIGPAVEWTNLETSGDFGPPREYITDHPILGKNTPVYEGGKPIYRERA